MEHSLCPEKSCVTQLLEYSYAVLKLNISNVDMTYLNLPQTKTLIIQ